MAQDKHQGDSERATDTVRISQAPGQPGEEQKERHQIGEGRVCSVIGVLRL